MSGETILVVDDSQEIVRHLAEHVLPVFGYRVIAAYDGRTGLKMIRDHAPGHGAAGFSICRR
jgi:CheY-like chemotaxis protein